MTLLEEASTREELTKALAASLKAKGIPQEFAEEIAPQLTQEFASYEVPPLKPGTMGALVGRYAIRKDDLKVFDALTGGLTAAASASFFMAHQPVLAANVAICVSLAKLIRSLATRGAFLDRDVLSVLTILKCNITSPSDPGLMPAEILEIIQRTTPEADLAWLQQRLDFLKEVPTRDGAATKLASLDASGRWRTHV